MHDTSLTTAVNTTVRLENVALFILSSQSPICIRKARLCAKSTHAHIISAINLILCSMALRRSVRASILLHYTTPWSHDHKDDDGWCILLICVLLLSGMDGASSSSLTGLSLGKFSLLTVSSSSAASSVKLSVSYDGRGGPSTIILSLFDDASLLLFQLVRVP